MKVASFVLPMVRRLLPRRVRTFLGSVYSAQADRIDLWLGRRNDLTPLRSLQFDGGRREEVGREFLGHFVALGGLKPHERVLDVGCGIGRMAVPLARYLSREGRYEGFDIVKRGIDWCRNKITPRYPHFRFQHADLFNKYYNPSGSCLADAWTFPYPSGSFDFVFAISVYTHMLPADTTRYLSEIARVLKPEGRCLATFFLLNDASRALLEAKKSTLDFRPATGTYRTTNPDIPEDAVAYDEPFILDAYASSGLSVRPPIRYGSWCERPDPLSYQDIIVARKEGRRADPYFGPSSLMPNSRIQ